jgi:hypothetical protein
MLILLNHGNLGIIGAICLCQVAKLCGKDCQVDCQALRRSLRWIVRRSEAGILEMEGCEENFVETARKSVRSLPAIPT